MQVIHSLQYYFRHRHLIAGHPAHIEYKQSVISLDPEFTPGRKCARYSKVSAELFEVRLGEYRCRGFLYPCVEQAQYSGSLVCVAIKVSRLSTYASFSRPAASLFSPNRGEFDCSGDIEEASLHEFQRHLMQFPTPGADTVF